MDTVWIDNVLVLRKLDDGGGGLFSILFTELLYLDVFFEAVLRRFEASEADSLALDHNFFFSLDFFLPTDGPPPNLLGAPYRTWKGFTPIYPELTGLGVNCNLFFCS